MTTANEVQPSVYETEVREILGKLDQSQRNVIADWLAKQRRLETEGDNGYSNVSVVVAWLLNRRYAVSEANLTTALTNSLNNGKRKIHFKELPKQDRSTATGRINHAIVNRSDEGFMPRSQTNRSYRQMMEENRSKPDTTQIQASVHDDYKSKAESVVGRTHAQTGQARKLFATVPGTTTIDWEATLAMRQRFVNKQWVYVRN
jgi:hypothetical protein